MISRGGDLRQESFLRSNIKPLVLLLFVGLLFADVVLGFYIIRERFSPSVGDPAATATPEAPMIQAAATETPVIALPSATPTVEIIAPTATPVPVQTIYVVRTGDTLYSIAKKYGVVVEELARVNQIEDVNLIYIGEELIIPAPQP